MIDLSPKRTTQHVYHHGEKDRKRKPRGIPLEAREFIFWDGEGINLDGPDKPQTYVLFGSNKDYIMSARGLSTFEILDHIIATGEANPGAVHVSFAFGYDANMIVKSLAPQTLLRLHKRGFVRLRNAMGESYTLTYAKGKYFRVTKRRSEYHHEHNSTAKTTVQIFDLFHFFMCSFIKACERMGIEVPEIVVQGKASRKQFTVDELDDIFRYWVIEGDMGVQLAEELRRRVYGAGLYIRQWHGPGALATYAMKEHGIKQHMKPTPDDVMLPVRTAYAAGRFELYQLGRKIDVYGIDLNSAYPYALSMVPSLVEGEWSYVDKPRKITSFGIYHLRLRRGGPFDVKPSPLYHRDKDHNLSFPWIVDGWYWGPEAREAVMCGARVLEGWEYRGWHTRPFAFVRDMYEQRRQWKEEGNAAQLALKLCMNAMTGKAAQRTGWTEENQRIPPFHQLEWAGWVTSKTRASMFALMKQIPTDKLIAVETDGIYTTATPESLGIQASDKLGGWSVDFYDEVFYVQSGLAWLRQGDEWTPKRRGLDADSFTLEQCKDYLATLHPLPSKEFPWAPFVGNTTRFVGMGQALASSIPTRNLHCRWVTDKREIQPAQHGKRIHVHAVCDACKWGLYADEYAHQLCINSMSSVDMHSYPHSIPWLPEEGHALWRDYEDSQGELIADV